MKPSTLITAIILGLAIYCAGFYAGKVEGEIAMAVHDTNSVIYSNGRESVLLEVKNQLHGIELICNQLECWYEVPGEFVDY